MVGFTCDKNSIDNPSLNFHIDYKNILKDDASFWMSLEGDEKVSLTIMLNPNQSRYISSLMIKWVYPALRFSVECENIETLEFEPVKMIQGNDEKFSLIPFYNKECRQIRI